MSCTADLTPAGRALPRHRAPAAAGRPGRPRTGDPARDGHRGPSAWTAGAGTRRYAWIAALGTTGGGTTWYRRAVMSLAGSLAVCDGGRPESDPASCATITRSRRLRHRRRRDHLGEPVPTLDALLSKGYLPKELPTPFSSRSFAASVASAGPSPPLVHGRWQPPDRGTGSPCTRWHARG